MFDKVKLSLLSFGKFSEEELMQVTSRLKPVLLKKGSQLFGYGDICQQFFYVNQGSFRQCQLLESGEEAVLNLFVENDWVLEYKSFISQTPAASIIIAAETSEVFSLSVWDFHELIRLSPGFFRMGNILEQANPSQEYRNTRLSPEERYERLLCTQPKIIQKFPLKQIASFLGMTPETLSRVRRRLIS